MQDATGKNGIEGSIVGCDEELSFRLLLEPDEKEKPIVSITKMIAFIYSNL